MNEAKRAKKGRSNERLAKTLIGLCEYHGLPFVEEILDVIKVVYNEVENRGTVGTVGHALNAIGGEVLEVEQHGTQAEEDLRPPLPADIGGCEVIDTPEFLAVWASWLITRVRAGRLPGSHFVEVQLRKLARVAEGEGIEKAVGLVRVATRLGYSSIFFGEDRKRSHPPPGLGDNAKMRVQEIPCTDVLIKQMGTTFGQPLEPEAGGPCPLSPPNRFVCRSCGHEYRDDEKDENNCSSCNAHCGVRYLCGDDRATREGPCRAKVLRGERCRYHREEKTDNTEVEMHANQIVCNGCGSEFWPADLTRGACPGCSGKDHSYLCGRLNAGTGTCRHKVPKGQRCGQHMKGENLQEVVDKIIKEVEESHDQASKGED